MVMHSARRIRTQRAAFMVEMMVAMALLTGALLPIAYSIASERRLAMASYQRAVAMEIVDGEMEVILAGTWRGITPGTHPYTVKASAATNLSAGGFLLTVSSNRLRLEWIPAGKHHGGVVAREVPIR